MNKLDREARSRILHLLCEGNSIRAVTRLTGVNKKSVSKLMIDAGQAAAWYQDRVFRNLTCKRIQVDEIWAFVYAKQKNVAGAKKAPANAGDVWTWTAIDADTKLIPSWFVGGRDSDAAIIFMDDLASRLANRVQLTSDGHKAYLEAVEGAFGADVDYAMLVKLYGESSEAEKRYSSAVCMGTRKQRIEGQPNPKYISTSCTERHNLTMGMSMRRFTRLTNSFSKKVENHCHALALYFVFYNFVRSHKALGKLTPALAAGVTDRTWEFSDIVTLIDAAEVEPKKRGSYKPRQPKSAAAILN